jgi:hypothetical protein
MKRKWLVIGISCTAVILLLLTSLMNVVGYQSLISTTVHESPLFTTRTQKATKQQQNIINARYLGMEKGKLIQIPPAENKTEILKTISEVIKKMDETTYHRFLVRLNQYLKANTISNEKQLYEILDEVTNIRKHNIAPIIPAEQMYSLGCPPSIFDSDNILCKLYVLFTLASYFIFIIIIIIYHLIHSLPMNIMLVN